MERIDVEPAHGRVRVRASRRPILLVVTLCWAYAALLSTSLLLGALHSSLKAYVVLGATALGPFVFLALGARRTFLREGDHLFVSGPFGLRGRWYDASAAELTLSSEEVAAQAAYRLTWSLPDDTRRVMCTWVASRHALIEALHEAMSVRASRAALEKLESLAALEQAGQRSELVTFASIACASIAATAAWLFLA